MPIMAWLHYADHALDPIRRSSSGSNVPIADTGGASEAKFQLGKLAQLFGNALGEVEEFYKKMTDKAGADWWGAKRIEEADWFQLIGMIANQPNGDASGTPTEGEFVLIGKQAIHTPKQSGYLYCFANDAWKFYGNNRGKVSLTVRRAP